MPCARTTRNPIERFSVYECLKKTVIIGTIDNKGAFTRSNPDLYGISSARKDSELDMLPTQVVCGVWECD
jgi:hypothetical protein